MNLYDQLIQLQVVPNAYENWRVNRLYKKSVKFR